MITLNQVCKLIESINNGDKYESFFEGDGSGNIKLIIQDKYYTIGGYHDK